MKAYTWEFKALTHIWTGDAERRGGRLITTGLLGSIRWWFEVVVRGLGGSACDPTDTDNRCPGESKKKPHEPGHHCVVCELFGCTGWARKFRFEVLNEKDEPIIDQITKNQVFRLRFTPLRAIADEEWALLDMTLQVISEYGALGAKIGLKPSEEAPYKDHHKDHHKDFGIVKFKKRSCLPSLQLETIKNYLQSSRWRTVSHTGFEWASLKNFWCVKGRYLARQNLAESNFNRVLGRSESKKKAKNDPSTNPDKWLAGSAGDKQAPEKKQASEQKIFSFKNPARTFGFVNPDGEANQRITFEEIVERLRRAWPNFCDNNFDVKPFVK